MRLPPVDRAAPAVAAIQPYQPGKPISELARELGLSDIIKLASNENPLGPSPKAVSAMRAVEPELALYPDGNGFALKQALSRHLGVGMEQITLGNGSNDVLVLLAEAFLTPESHAVYSQYAFAVYPLAVQATGAQAGQVPATADLGHDLDAMLAAVNEHTRIVFVANPNNPTGHFIARERLRAFAEALPANVLLVVDEAYHEYLPPDESWTALDWLDDFPNLVVTRTFSKAYGLAGLRVGYAVSHAAVADLLNRIRQPFNVNALALAAAEAALQDSAFLQQAFRVNRQGMAMLEENLTRLGLAFVPSRGNFLLVDMGRPAGPLYEALLRKGVIVRPVGNYGLPNHLRVSIGTEAEMQYFCRALEQVLNES